MAENESKKLGSVTDHLANDRTFLAWIRTSMGIIAFGFVVKKFALFLHQIAFFVEEGKDKPPMPVSLVGFSSLFGIALILIGGAISVLAFFQYRQAKNQIEQGLYQPSILLNGLLAITIVAITLILIFYLP